MNRLEHTRKLLQQRKARLSMKVRGTQERPRLTVSVSNTAISAQIIDDTNGTTLSSVSVKTGKNMTEKAAAAGSEIAKKAKAKKISQVAFDKNGRQYQQRLRSFAEAARKEGLEF